MIEEEEKEEEEEEEERGICWEYHFLLSKTFAIQTRKSECTFSFWSKPFNAEINDYFISVTTICKSDFGNPVEIL